MMTTQMTDAARHVLHQAILRHLEETGEQIPLDGWEHYSTGMTDEGIGTFGYDRADGRSLYITTSSSHTPTIDRERSILYPMSDDEAGDALDNEIMEQHGQHPAEATPRTVFDLPIAQWAWEGDARDLDA